ncbi:MAG: type II toxin-antitoxin system ParD family antitoxin [Myxococcales bacterium]|nr:type II toxin-antitoxin system ParD family antitoxin [Myxococcales bacterium]
MNVSLTPELESFIQQKVQSGLYNSASEVVREALRLLHEQEQIRQLRIDGLRSQLQAGLDDIDAGRVQPLDDALVANIKARGRAQKEQS